MGSLTPPWADELLARNTKIARKMMSSMSTESYFDEPDLPSPTTNGSLASPQSFIPLSTGPSSTSTPVSSLKSTSVNGERKVVDPTGIATARMASSQSPTSPTTSLTSSLNKASRVKRQHPTRNTEKLSPIRNERDSMFDEDTQESKKSFEMTNGGEDLSILEYGPGIVKKLRSRYQSLALRQYNARPSLRRSASLENCLDAVSAEDLASTLESKISASNLVQTEEAIDTERIITGEQRGRKLRSSEETNGGIPELATVQQNGSSVAKPVGGGPRGRTSGPDASARRDRMRRARSVDALHRTKREEEILEKFKHVVLPKEEIVIIEVSKPQQDSVINSANVFNQESGIQGGGAEKRFPTRLLLTSNNLRNNTVVLDQQTANRVRNLISPEHELPPHDIVRETARIFERNQENLSRRIGQALRLSKSQSTTSVVSSNTCTSPPLTPPSPTPSSTNINTIQQKAVMAQSTTTSLTSSMQPQDKSFSTKTSGKVEANNTAQTNTMANGPSHGHKQVGIIKPTLSNNSASVTSKITNGESKVDRGRSPILSPIGFASQNHKPLIQNSLKPPLSPKPIFTSSPKVNIIPGPATAVGNTSAKTSSLIKQLAQESPSTSPILIIESRSISPFKSESPVPRGTFSADTGRSKSPVSSKPPGSPSPLGEERSDAFMRSASPINGKSSPVEAEASVKRLGNHNARSISPDGPNKLGELKPKTVVSHVSLQNGQTTEQNKIKEVTKAQAPAPAPPPRTTSPSTSPVENSNSKISQLRAHQNQKKASQGGNGSMVFNFTGRKDVPDYIEDDGLRRSSRDAEERVGSAADKDSVDSKMLSVIPMFEGANVIINGRSSIQKKPKAQKLNISFNEEATTTYEYPSESSFVIDEDPTESEDSGPKKPNVISGTGSLGSYTPKVGANTYQLGSYASKVVDGSSGHKKVNGKQSEEEENEFIEDYLKPNTESTTWSNEMSADILF